MKRNGEVRTQDNSEKLYMRLFSGNVKLFLYGDYDTSYYSRLQGRVTNLHMELSNGKGDRIVFPLPEGKDLRRNEFERLFSSFAPYGFIFDMELVEELLAHTEKQISYRDLEGSPIPFSYKQIIKCGTAREGEGKEDDDAIADAIPTLMDLIWHGGVLGVDCAKLGGTDATEDIKRECLASYKAFVRFLSPQHFEDKWFQKMAEAQMARIDKAWAFLSSNFDFLEKLPNEASRKEFLKRWPALIDGMRRLSYSGLFDINSFPAMELDANWDKDWNKVVSYYKNLVRFWHPDHYSRNPKMRSFAETQLIRINDAFNMLSEFHRC